MRNVFDQYVHPENRLTHALVCCLAEDPALLASFLRWMGVSPPRGERLQVVEQRLPGEAEERREVSALIERRLPDAWVFTESGWALLLESKIASPIDAAQLRGHLSIAERRGFASVELLVLSPGSPLRALPDRCRHRRWSDVYRWACGERGSVWARHLSSYLPIAEQRMVDDGYLVEGTLTTFTGIPFGADHPYTYLEGKRLLRLLMAALRADVSLDTVGIDRSGEGRPAITEGPDSVWDFLPLTVATPGAAFTRFPHATVALQRDRLIAQITLPNGLDGALRRAVLAGGYPAFKATVAACVDALAALLTSDRGVAPLINIQQRRYASQRSIPERDAVLEFDPRTAVGGCEPVKPQEEWLKAAYDVFCAKQSNLQLAIGVQFAYTRSTRVRDAVLASAIAEAWTAMQPLLARLQASNESGAGIVARRRQRVA